MVPYTRIGWDRSPRVRADQADAEGWAETSRQIWTDCVAGEMAGHVLELIDACVHFCIFADEMLSEGCVNNEKEAIVKCIYGGRR